MTALDEMLQAQLVRLDTLTHLPIAVDTETTGFDVGGDAVTIGVSISCDDVSIYVPFHHETGDNASVQTQEMLSWLLETWDGPMVFANVVFDLLALENLGIYVESRDLWDVILMAHLIDENMPRSKSLDALAKHYIGPDVGKVDDPFIEKEKKTGWKHTTWQQMWLYATVDTDLTLEVYEVLRPKFAGEAPPGLWEHKQRFFRTLLAMRRYGVRVDRDLASKHVSTSGVEMSNAKRTLGLADDDTLGPKALERLIHDELGVPILFRTSTGKPSFDAKKAMPAYESELEQLDSPIAGALKTYRGWQKASSAASIPYLNLVSSDGRLRCSYKMHGTVTGRLSCEKPNLQQIPKSSDKPWNGTLKEQFIAEDGFTLVNADYSQLELRLGTAYAGEESLRTVFAEGRDIFDEMSAALGMTRQDTKTLVYSIQYGAGANRVMEAFRVTKAQAEALILNYRRTYPRFARTAQKVSAEAERKGRIRLWSGRYRRFAYPSESYKAWNALIQGGGADIVERCMVYLYETLHSDSCRMLLTVHDSVVFEVEDSRVPTMMPAIKSAMEDVQTYTGFDFGVHFAVETEFWSPREAAKHA